MWIVGSIIQWVLWVFLLVLFARMILSWVPVLVRDWEPKGPMLVFAEIIYSITDPPLKLIRKVLRPVRVGNMMLDLAFIGLAIMVAILMQVNAALLAAGVTTRQMGSASDRTSRLRRFRPPVAARLGTVGNRRSAGCHRSSNCQF